MTETQEHLLELLKEIDDICKKYGIEYYLAGGSLVGAVRHGGFLPWDDDADIHMSRENAQKFLDAVQSEGRNDRTVYIDTELSDNMNTHWRYQNTGTTCLLRGSIGSLGEQGQFVDIFPYYPLPNDEEKKKKCLEDFELYVEYKSENAVSASSKRDSQYLKRYFRLKRWEKLVGRKTILKYLENKMFQFPDADAEEVLLRCQMPPKRNVEKYIWGTPRYTKFENVKLPVPEYAEKLLSYEYGPSWFEVPLQAERGEHVFVTDFDIPYTAYISEYNKHLNVREFYYQESAKKDYWFHILDDRNVVNPQIHTMRGLKIALEIQNKIETLKINLKELVAQRKKEELEILFKPYFRFLSLEEIRYWGLYIDMPDDYLFAALYFSCFDGNYGMARKILKARREQQNRELTDDLKELCELCDATDELLTEMYGNLDYKVAREIAENWLSRYPNLLYFMRAKMCLDLLEKEDHNPKALLEQCEEYLSVYEDDGELLKYKGDLLFMDGKKQEAELCYKKALNRLRNGYCITQIKEYFREKSEE